MGRRGAAIDCWTILKNKKRWKIERAQSKVLPQTEKLSGGDDHPRWEVFENRGTNPGNRCTRGTVPSTLGQSHQVGWEKGGRFRKIRGEGGSKPQAQRSSQR